MQGYEYAEGVLGRLRNTWIGFALLPGSVVRVVAVDPTRIDFLNTLGKDGWVVWNISDRGEDWSRWLSRVVNPGEFNLDLDQLPAFGALSDWTCYSLRREIPAQSSAGPSQGSLSA